MAVRPGEAPDRRGRVQVGGDGGDPAGADAERDAALGLAGRQASSRSCRRTCRPSRTRRRSPRSATLAPGVVCVVRLVVSAADAKAATGLSRRRAVVGEQGQGRLDGGGEVDGLAPACVGGDRDLAVEDRLEVGAVEPAAHAGPAGRRGHHVAQRLVAGDEQQQCVGLADRRRDRHPVGDLVRRDRGARAEGDVVGRDGRAGHQTDQREQWRHQRQHRCLRSRSDVPAVPNCANSTFPTPLRRRDPPDRPLHAGPWRETRSAPRDRRPAERAIPHLGERAPGRRSWARPWRTLTRRPTGTQHGEEARCGRSW